LLKNQAGGKMSGFTFVKPADSFVPGIHMTTIRSTRFKLLQIAVLVATVLAVAAIARTLNRNEEYEWFKKAYGPAHHSQYIEEWLVRDFFKDERGGVFVDVGAYEYERDSNTYYLDHVLGWSGVAVDAQQEFAADYAKYRPRTRFFTFFVSDHSDGIESFFVPRGVRLVASSNKDFADRYDSSGQERKVPTITLNALLERAGVTRIDFLTMDIELAEPKALAGFDIARYRPRLVCVEAHPEVRQAILDYFTERRYRVIGRYLRADPENLWFAPADQTIPTGVPIGNAH
jgi:FkbM family methyltransferase